MCQILVTISVLGGFSFFSIRHLFGAPLLCLTSKNTLFKKPSLKNVKTCVSENTINIGFLKGVFVLEKNKIHRSLIAS